MARAEHDREDLLAEAVAMVQRCELRAANCDELVLIGFRPDGCGSIYFGTDEAYHFNTAGQLRRAYRDGLLFKADGGRIVSLRRVRTAAEVALIRHQLCDDEQRQFLASMRGRIQSLMAAIEAGEFQIVRCVAQRDELLARIRGWLPAAALAVVAPRPHAR